MTRSTSHRALFFRTLASVLLVVLLSGAALAEQGYAPFIRIDSDDPEGWTKALKNVRIVTGDRFQFREPDPKYGIDPSFVPSTEGMDTLNISASAQFGEAQFLALADELEAAADGREIYVFDLRRECHALLNGIAFSQYALHNWSNAGMDAAQVEAAETALFGAMVGTTLRACPKEDDAPGEVTEYSVDSFMTERALVEGRGFHYIRIPVTDHSWPEPEQVDAFVAFVKGIDTDRVWLHFHCHAGKGRTVLYMIMYDKMKNPDVPMRDIIIRQTLLGGTYPLYTEDSGSYKAPLYREKARMTVLFFQYVDENIDTDYQVPWSEWLAEQEQAPDAA